jgi:glycerophosphoryl diester phosphodiesterase
MKFNIGGILWPENTLSAIEFGYHNGYRAVEFDVMLSKDKVPILMHDDILGRTIQKTELIGVSVNDVDISTLLELDVGSWFDPNLSHIRIPLFEDVLSYCISNHIFMNIEIKPVPGYESETGKVVAEITSKYFTNDTSTIGYPLFSSFSFESLLAAQKVAPYIPRGYLIDDLDQVPDWKARMQQIRGVSINTNYKKLTIDLVEEIKSEGYQIFCYTINDVDIAQDMLKSGINAFCTDQLHLFKEFTVSN